MPELTPLSKYFSFILSLNIGWNRFSHLALLDSSGYSCLSSFSYKFHSQSLNIHTHTNVGIFIWIALNLQINLGISPIESSNLWTWHFVRNQDNCYCLFCVLYKWILLYLFDIGFVRFINFAVCNYVFLLCITPLCAYSTIYVSILLLMGICVVSTQFEAPVWTVLLPIYLFTCFDERMYTFLVVYISHLIFKLKWKVPCLWLLPLLIQQSTPSTLSCIKCLFLLWDIFLDLIYFPLVHFSGIFEFFGICA